MSSAGTARKVEIVLDTACGWSFLGYTRFTHAVSHYRADGGTAEVTFRPFQLDPAASTAGEPLLEVLRRKFGGHAVQEAADFAALAAREGLEVNYDRALHSNTFEAHRLIATAARQGLAEPMVGRLFRAHYTDGLNVGDPGTLAKLAAEIGVVTGGHEAGAGDLRAELARVRRSGIGGVPVFRVDGGAALPGAQTVDSLLAALRG